MVCFFFLLFHVCGVKAAVEPKIIQVSDFTEEETFAYLKMPWNLSKEEAEEFLEDCMAVEVKNIKEVRKYLDEAGADVSGMSDEELEEACEVFTLPSGGYLIVEG